MIVAPRKRLGDRFTAAAPEGVPANSINLADASKRDLGIGREYAILPDLEDPVRDVDQDFEMNPLPCGNSDVADLAGRAVTRIHPEAARGCRQKLGVTPMAAFIQLN